jgi:hypothetical protein
MALPGAIRRHEEEFDERRPEVEPDAIVISVGK